MKKYCFGVISVSFLVSLAPMCGVQSTEKKVEKMIEKSDASQTPYQFGAPDQSFNLSADLNEISGLSLASNADELVAIHDELGELFFISKKNGALLRRTKFATDGDFEGIEFVKEAMYVVKSKGTIYKITNIGTVGQHVEKIVTELSKVDNIEGLGYSAAENALLLAGKGQKIGETIKKIYFVSLGNYKIINTLTISLTDFKNFLQDKPQKRYEKLKADYDEATENLEFGPSAVALHPISGELYILSSINKLLLRTDKKGKILDIVKLDKNIHRQPEGLCFDRDGTLFISNESKDGSAPQLHVFKPLGK